jgi:hypothetical protein
MRDPLTKAHVATQLARLNTVFPKYGDKELAGLVYGYFDALHDLDTEQLEAAHSIAIRNEPRFPVPSKLREHSRSWTTATRMQHQPVQRADEPSVGCRTCGSRPRLAVTKQTHWKTGEVTLLQRYLLACDPHQHPAGTGYIPLPEHFVEWA